ncbi:Na(+):H(+) antiporter [Oceanobacillus iheyensis HTE831]|uniref:Na(+):H(+) antiporter n=1 Tax=Oceanobacillus iheyensis (strain DSM 14371 / CIP 107618 / JCM 11309 / KCTC 3954 / HTE831) TaxID=221109 RepID=Q8EPU2_OCEIH|nr:Na+/H+ antiporter subunit E [Oceanobacillus iheyensis]BAC13951.1 Na(+):H(+) antiporter [Oceanobacillus iheyensis HTE831]
MPFQILLNVLIAFLWMFLQNDYTAITFVVGYLIGILLLFFIRRFLKSEFYFKRVWAAIKLIFLFLKELIKANIDVVRIVLSPKLNNEPGIVAVETKLETNLEISLLAALITLTPGTVSMDFSPDSKTIYVHAIDVPDREEVIRDVQNTFERAIMEVTK